MQKYAKFLGLLLTIIASTYAIHETYAYFTRVPTLAEMQADRDTKNQTVRDRCHLDSTSHATGKTERAKIISAREWEDSCLQEYMLGDINSNSGTLPASIEAVPPSSSIYSYQINSSNEHINSNTRENSSEVSINGYSGSQESSTITIDKNRTEVSGSNHIGERKTDGENGKKGSGTQVKKSQQDVKSILGLDNCRIVQYEDSHITQKRGHVYATDIACEVGRSFTVSAPQWKKSYTVKSIGYDQRIGNYIVLENGNYMFVFGHTKSPQKIGDTIPAGSQIGYTDISGVTEGVHLHFELWRDGYNITSDEMLGKGSKWNNEYSYRLLTQRSWFTGISNSIDFIASFEGFRDTSYEDPKGSGRWSIGFGTHANGPGEKITLADAKVRIYTKVFENMEFIYKNRLAISWNERIALSAFFYNLGTARPEMIAALKKRNIADLEKLWKSYKMPGSIYEKGLAKRRTAEWLKFISR